MTQYQTSNLHTPVHRNISAAMSVSFGS